MFGLERTLYGGSEGVHRKRFGQEIVDAQRLNPLGRKHP
jgi:hypothetical protein